MASPPKVINETEPRYSLRGNRGVPSERLSPEDWRKIAVLDVKPDAFFMNPDEEQQPFIMKLSEAENQDETLVPVTYSEAMNSPEAEGWKAAINEELESLKNKEVYEPGVPPPGVKPLKTKFVFSKKINKQGKEERKKARFVACGYSQRYLIDYFQTKADVAASRSIRMILAIAALKGYDLTQLDVKTAFLNSELKEEIWIHAPEGSKDKYWRLKKALYGLVQAAYEWRRLVDFVLKKFGLIASSSDPSVYYHITESSYLALAVHVDDMIIVHSDDVSRDELINHLKRMWDLKVDFNPTWLLKMRITRDRKSGSITIDQNAYILSILSKFQPLLNKYKSATGARIARVPIPAGTYLTPTENESDLSQEETELYQSVVGSGLYAAVQTRPDLAVVTGHFGKFLHNPSLKHLMALIQFLDYLQHTQNLGLKFTPCPGKITVTAHSDANFANDSDRHSIMAYTVKVGDNLISWLSKRIGTLCLSTQESELTAATEATRELMAVKILAKELKIIGEQDDVYLFVDNEPAVKTIQNPGYTGRLKHVDVCHKYVMEAHQKGIIKVGWCAGTDMLADALTKPVAAPALEKFRREVMKTQA